MARNSQNQPLNGLRILDLCDGLGDGCGRYLADLGAQVLLIEPPTGSAARRKAPLVEGYSTWFATQAANKQSVVLDSRNETDCHDLIALAQQADILIHDRSETALNWLSSIAELTAAPGGKLVVLSISEFGDSGPYANYQASNAVHMAMAGHTARSGLKNREPLQPPGQISYAAASIQATWVALLGFWQRLHTGQAGNIDFSVFEATCQILDPALGVTGSAAGGQSASKLAPRGRPPEGKMYPFFRCADGFVRVCILNPRQWQAMSEWLGDEHPFTDPSFGHIGKRMKVMRDINALIDELFIEKTAMELVAEGQQRGIPIAAVATPGNVLVDEHFVARDAFTDVQLGSDLQGAAPAGFLEINGKRAGIRHSAPALGSHAAEFDAVAEERWHQSDVAAARTSTTRRPFEGLRVLDLGVIVAGAELGRLFADQGAEVIKVETSAYPDGLRQSLGNEPMTDSFAQGNRGKQSLGLNLRSEEGKGLFRELVRKSDIVMSNFKPGTMASLGFSDAELQALNPRLIISESSALGATGPRSKSMGYGPLVRAATGLTGLWRYPDDERGFGDALTIFPDHMAARVSACAILALLIDRERTGKGGIVRLSQAETILMCLAPELLTESLKPGWLTANGNQGRFDAPANLFACAGDDEWCAIDIGSDAHWQALCAAMEREDLAKNTELQSAEGRLAQRKQLEQEVAQWAAQREARPLAEQLQRAGVPAGAMLRIHEVPEDPHLQARDYFRINEQPGLEAPLVTENSPAGKSFLPEPDIRPAPLVAQHTREIAKTLLGLDDARIASLIEAGDLEVLDEKLAAIAH